MVAGKNKNRGSAEEADVLSPEKASQLLKLLEALGMSPTLSEPAAPKEHKFWSTQPVPKSQAEVMNVKEDGPVQPEKPKIPLDPLPLPAQLSWCLVDITEGQDKADLYQLLNENYVEDLDAKFRFDYPTNFLNWYHCMHHCIVIPLYF